MTLLPNTSGELEQKLEQLGERYEFDSPLEILWNPYLCPEEALVYLAWALSVDNWSESWPIEVRRNVVANSLDIHRLKGTTKSLEDALTSLGFDLTARYWYDDLSIVKGKFRVTVAASGVSIDEKFYNDTLAVINENKRGTLHLEAIEIQTESKAKLFAASHLKIGESIRSLPRKPKPFESAVRFKTISSLRIKEVTRIFPN